MWVPCRPRLREYDDDSSSAEWCRASASGRTSTRWPGRSTSRERSGTRAGASSRRWRGPRRIFESFARRIRDDAPPLAIVSAVESEDVPTLGGTEFTIRESETAAGRTFVSPDVTICDDCLAELRDPGNRRYGHPFITCTNCGPRYTITTGLPYDRPATTMAGFPMCAACATEYADPADRRFHAQTVCCPDVRTEAPAGGARARDVVRRRRPRRGPVPAREGRGRRREGDRRLPPGVRRDRRGRGGDVAQAQAARRQAVRGDGRLARRRPRGRGAHLRRGPTSSRAGAARSCSPPGDRARSPTRWPPARPTSACCWPTRRCTTCCSTRPRRGCW